MSRRSRGSGTKPPACALGVDAGADLGRGGAYYFKYQPKRRGYRGAGGGDGRPRSWWVEVDKALFEAQIAYLDQEIYMRRVRPRAQRITACERYKAS